MSVHSLTLAEIARALGGEVSGQEVLAPGPGHSGRDRSMSVRLSTERAGGFVVRSYAGDPFDLCRDHVADVLGLTDGHWRQRRPADPAEVRRRQEARELDEQEARAKAKYRRDLALATWSEAGDPRRTAVDAHLGGRCLDLSDELAGEVLRFHPRCPWGRETVPAMVALVRNVVTNEPQAIHRTALDALGRKVSVNGHARLALGSIAGGAVKLTGDADVTTCLGIGEGIETTLSLRRTEFGTSPAWAMISANGIETLPVLSGIECLWIAVDNDPAGRRAAETAAARWRAAGRETYRLIPDAPGADLNDAIKGAARG